MNKFVKRNTTRDIEIFGNTYSVDFGKDDLPVIFQEVADESKAVIGKKTDHAVILEKQKTIFKAAINKIIGEEEASEQIFEEDNSAILHSDIYTFLVGQFNEVMADESPYNPKRIK